MLRESLPSIYYVCSLPISAGGELVNFQHVASLRQHGFRAFALLDPLSRITLKHHPYSVPMVHWDERIKFTQDDWLVVPEVTPYEHILRLLKLPCQLIIHNQNPFFTFRGFPSVAEMNAHRFKFGLSCSEFTRATLLEWGSNTDWQVVRPMVLSVFTQQDQQEHRKRQIAFMPRKRSDDVSLLKGVFKSLFPEHSNVPWVRIEDLSRRQVAQVLRESLIFASLSKNEGLGLPPLEAMASGCLVCGYDGGGGQEYTSAENGWWVSEGDWIGYAEAINLALLCSPEEGRRRISAGKLTSESFGKTQFEAMLIGAWRHMLETRESEYKIANFK